MQADRLTKNGTIGIICPCHVADRERYGRIAATIERLGFKVKFGRNIEKNTYGYAASAEERAADLNDMVSDQEVQMVLFGGGESASEILPYIDYNSIRCHPKLFSSYSDGTSILNAIYAQTGLTTYYGIGTSEFYDLRYYDYTQFCSHFVEGYEAKQFVSDSRWVTINGGICEGALIGGYTSLFGLMLANKYFKYDADTKYLLFLEDHERYNSGHVGVESSFLAFIEQSAFMQNVSGLIFGHYADQIPENLAHTLERFGRRNRIPVVYTDDFGHGTKHAVLPIGRHARLDADKQDMAFTGQE